MPLFDAIDTRYLFMLSRLADRSRLEINTDCPECGDQLPPGYLDRLKFAEIHTVMRLHTHGTNETHSDDQFTVVIGCEGYHIMDSDTGKIKDHDDVITDQSFEITDHQIDEDHRR